MVPPVLLQHLTLKQGTCINSVADAHLLLKYAEFKPVTFILLALCNKFIPSCLTYLVKEIHHSITFSVNFHTLHKSVGELTRTGEGMGEG